MRLSKKIIFILVLLLVVINPIHGKSRENHTPPGQQGDHNPPGIRKRSGLVFADSDTWNIIADNDDIMYYRSSDIFSLTGYIQMGDFSVTHHDLDGAFRFQTVEIPQGATINSASLEIQANSFFGTSFNLNVYGEDSDDTITFSDSTDYLARPRTAATVSWSVSGWTDNTRYNTSDIKTIIQEIVDRGGWSENNSIVLFVQHASGFIGTEQRAVAYGYDQDPAKAAKLFIDWDAGYNNPDPPELLFGAGFNESTPYVELHWDHNLNDTDFFEVQNSTDKISWDTLGTTNTTEYIDYEVENGTQRYYRVRACIDQPDGWHNSTFTDINFEEVFFLLGSGGCPPGGDNITILAGDWATFNVANISIVAGTYVHGNTSSPVYVDGKTYLVNEVTGLPGFDVRFNFTGVPENSTSLALLAFVQYEGNPAHTVHIEGFNFDLGEWVHTCDIPEFAMSWHNYSLSIGGYIQNDTGNVWVRIHHVTSGSSGHWLSVDYLRLRAFVPTGGVDPNLDAWSINWLLSIIWLALVAIGIFDRNKIIIMFAGFFGVILAILMLTENMMVAVALLCINLYLLYEGTK